MRFKKKKTIYPLILLILILLLVIINIPNARLISKLEVKTENLTDGLLIVDLPQQIWSGQDETIRLQLIMVDLQTDQTLEDQGQTYSGYETIQNLEVDFVLTGATLNPPGVFRTPILKENDINMNWKIKLLSDQDIKGTFWVSIISIRDGQELEKQRELIFSREIIIQNKLLLGLRKTLFQWLLVFLLLLNIFFWLKSLKKPPGV